MNRQAAYRALVAKRKHCQLCSESGLTNPACIKGGIYDSDQIGPWSCWQGNLNAEIMVVGQDWGDTTYFLKWKGLDDPAGNPTNTNLQRLLRQLGIVIKTPQEPQEHSVFFTNIILCLKDGGLQAPIKDEWLTNCSGNFFRPLVDIIRPKIILSMSEAGTKAILRLYGVSFAKSVSVKKMIEDSPYRLTETTLLFPIYHCGNRVINRHRSLEKQLEDWARVAAWLRTSPCAEDAR